MFVKKGHILPVSEMKWDKYMNINLCKIYYKKGKNYFIDKHVHSFKNVKSALLRQKT